VVGWTTAITFLLEIVIIMGQVIRGTSSHFNVATPLDTALWSTMGTAIVVQTLASIGLAVALWRARFADHAMGWALRLGLIITIAGAATGGLMTGPTAAQLDGMRAGQRPVTIGAHTVGGRDGGPGLAGTGWSTEHGDLRVPHFLGLHAFQAPPRVAGAASDSNHPGRSRELRTAVRDDGGSGAPRAVNRPSRWRDADDRRRSPADVDHRSVDRRQAKRRARKVNWTCQPSNYSRS
jgi:hypothetical protein